MSGSTRVFVRLFDGRETDDEVVTLPPPPLAWKAVITAMAAAVHQPDHDPSRARLFLLPSEAQGIAAELNARALRFGVRENDRFVLCLNGEDYQQPADGASDGNAAALVKSDAPTSTSMLGNGALAASRAPPSGSIGSAAPPGGLMGLSSGKKGNKRYRSISGKMAAIKSLGDKGLISSEDRGHLKDLLLNNDSPQLQEALDKYNSTGDFQAVKDLLLKELQNPSAKRNTGDWLSESLVHDISLSFSTSDTPTAQSSANGKAFGDAMTSSDAASSLSTGSVSLSYQSTDQQQVQASLSMSSYPQTTPMTMGFSTSMAAAPTMSPVVGSHSSTSLSRPATLSTPGGYQAQPTVMPDPFNHPQMSPTNVYAPPAPQINLPLRDRNGFMKRTFDASPGNAMNGMGGMNGMMVPVGASPAVTNMGYSLPQQPQTQYAMSQGYSSMAPGYTADMSAYSRMAPGMNMYGVSTPAYNPYQQQGYAAMPGAYPYGTLIQDPNAVPGYDFYSAGYGYGKTQLRVGGKWTTTPPMPSYPPPCSKEEKKEKIARWLKKRENRNWSNKPSYPVRHSIAKNRKRGEDGRFITKARLAEMAAEEAAAAAGGDGGVDGSALDLDDHHEPGMLPEQPSMLAPTPVV